MRFNNPKIVFFFLLLVGNASAEEVVFYETVPVIGKLVIMAVAIGIPTFIILSHIPLFEILDTDKLPVPPKLSKPQTDTLKGTVVGVVFGLLLTVLTIILL